MFCRLSNLKGIKRSNLGSFKKTNHFNFSKFVNTESIQVRYYASVENASTDLKFSKLDEKWIEKWEKLKNSSSNLEEIDLKKKEKFYVLSMFPYPSGMLHIGHLRVYTIDDVLARYHRYQGKNVINPMGWDAFGLPAENAAIERKINPKDWTMSNIAKMKAQLKRMALSFDWERELSTCDKSYYKHTQEIFLWMYEHGFAYKKLQEINWDPVDMTVLANEQVDASGKSWRSGAQVEKKLLNQWFLKISDFGSELSDDLKKLKDWPPQVKLMQKNWIGKSVGANVKFLKLNSVHSEQDSIEVFTSRPDTLFSVQYVAVSLDHNVTLEAASKDPELAKFIQNSKAKESENSFKNRDFEVKSKEGCLVKGYTVRNPINGKEIPVFAAPYVLSTYGNGAVMGCPAHDERDFDFWKKNCPNEEVIATVLPKSKSGDVMLPYTEKSGILANVPDDFVGLDIKSAASLIIEKLNSQNLGGRTITCKLRDWLISRQRYWGCPIPIIKCDDCGLVPVPKEQLPVELPEDIELTGKGNPLDSHEGFKNCKCPNCSKPAVRETDTMDTFMDSSWYYFRYLDPHNSTEPFNTEKIDKFMPVDLYVGGIEHAILHLLYSRFFAKVFSKIGKWPAGDSQSGEPFKRLVSQGMVHGKTYIHPETKRFLRPDLELTVDKKNQVVMKNEINKDTGKPLIPEITFEKMSKLKYNGVDPVKFIEKYGADATRAHMLFQAPIDMILFWDEEKISGVQRWLRKVIRLHETVLNDTVLLTSKKKYQKFQEVMNECSFKNNEEITKDDALTKIFNSIQTYLKQTDEAFSKTLSLNTVISDYMKLTNDLVEYSKLKSRNSDLLFDGVMKLIIMMSPVTPIIAEELFEKTLSHFNISGTSIFADAPWPEVLPKKYNKAIKYKVIVDGKFKFNYESLNFRDIIDKRMNNEDEQFEIGMKFFKEMSENPNGFKEKDLNLLNDMKNKIDRIIIRPGAFCFVTK